MNNLDIAKEKVAQMSLEEKAGLCSGMDTWHTKSVERLGVGSIMVSDGPHGLRKQKNSQDNLGIGESIPATCFPTASLTACSFDPTLTYEMGVALGEECLQEEVSVILGPGVNMKRSPLCGRNFEYYSEDPLVAGKMAAGFIKGVQSTGVGTSLKHFAANNQERRRMNVSATVDKRALHEIYLKPFEIAVKEAKPRTVMCSYNKINDVYSSENPYLLNTVLRKKWGYEGLVVSDWGAVHLRDEGVAAGLDLEMPGSNGVNDKKIIEAVNNGTLSIEDLDKAAVNVTKLILDGKAAIKKDYKYDADKHHKLACKVAAESMVLLKNENEILPLKDKSIAVIGEMAKKVRYQGAGSSKINPNKLDIPLQKLEEAGVSFDFVDSYDVDEAIIAAKKYDTVVIFAGLTEKFESEGFDRKNISMPEEQNKLISEISKINKNVVVVLMGGASIELPWFDEVKGVLLAYLGGEGVGSAVTDILTGKICPSGKLAETWPLKLEDNPSYANFPGDRLHVNYKESIFIGYRYYDTVKQPVRFMFGDGLSYTKFEYIDVSTDKEEYSFGDKIKLTYTIKNVGSVSAKETTFVFSNNDNDVIFKPARQLAGFNKIELASNEEKTVSMEIDTRELGYYDISLDDYNAITGEYCLCVGGSLSSLPLKVQIHLTGKEVKADAKSMEALKDYFDIASGKRIAIFDECFENLYGYKLPEPAKAPTRPFTKENCLEDVQNTFFGKMMLNMATKFMTKKSSVEEDQDQMMLAAIREMPFFALQASSGGMISEGMMKFLIKLFNL